MPCMHAFTRSKWFRHKWARFECLACTGYVSGCLGSSGLELKTRWLQFAIKEVT